MGANIKIGLASENEINQIVAKREYLISICSNQKEENWTEAVQINEGVFIGASNKTNKSQGYIEVSYISDPQIIIDKYPSIEKKILLDNTFEIKQILITRHHDEKIFEQILNLLLYSVHRWVDAHDGKRTIVISKSEFLNTFLAIGFVDFGLPNECEGDSYHLLLTETTESQKKFDKNQVYLTSLEKMTDWKLGIPYYKSAGCFHGGDFFNKIGTDFQNLQIRDEIINADVLDAWFPPSPRVIKELKNHLQWLVQTSPPADSAGLVRTIASIRGIDPECILTGTGSSGLIFLAFRQWLSSSSRVLILDPMYGEYAHILENVIRCNVERLLLTPENEFQVNLEELVDRIKNNFDLIVIVNPNSPTGKHLDRENFEQILNQIPINTRVWIDETYIDYTGTDQSLEKFAANSENIIIGKSMSKVYSLSGVRCGYICGCPHILDELRSINPPWVVSLPGQVAAVNALQDPEYYEMRYKETHKLRNEFVHDLSGIQYIETIFPSVANFVMVKIANSGPSSKELVKLCKEKNLFLRDISNMGVSLGQHYIRIAIKDRETNKRILKIVQGVMEMFWEMNAGF